MELAITELALGKCEDTVSKNSFIRSTFDREWKHVSIGQYIMVDSRMLILDESTSGLDSTCGGAPRLLVVELRQRSLQAVEFEDEQKQGGKKGEEREGLRKFYGVSHV